MEEELHAATRERPSADVAATAVRAQLEAAEEEVRAKTCELEISEVRRQELMRERRSEEGEYGAAGTTSRASDVES